MGWNRMDIISTIKHFFHELITFKYRKSYLWFINLWYILMSHIFIIFLFGIYFRDLSFLVTHGHLLFSFAWFPENGIFFREFLCQYFLCEYFFWIYICSFSIHHFPYFFCSLGLCRNPLTHGHRNLVIQNE